MTTPKRSKWHNEHQTTAAGNNANSGKSQDAPMASLRALLAAYDLDAGDTILIRPDGRLRRDVLQRLLSNRDDRPINWIE